MRTLLQRMLLVTDWWLDDHGEVFSPRVKTALTELRKCLTLDLEAESTAQENEEDAEG